MSSDSRTGLCRDEETLADYVEGRLDGPGRAAVEAWLAEDDDAFDLVVLARAAVDEERALMGRAFPVGAPQCAARDRAKALYVAPAGLHAVFRLVRGALDLVDSLGGAWVPVAAPAVRGAGPDSAAPARDLWEAAVPAGGMTLTVEVERTGAGAVIVAGVDRPEGVQVALLRDGAVLSARPATAAPAELAEVGPGAYRVEARRGGVAVGRAFVVLEAA